MADIPDYLKLVRIPRGETTFYLYPEHVGLEEKILNSKGIRYLANPKDSTRQVFLCASGDFKFVQKIERSADDKFRRKNNHLLPAHGNMAAHEVSMARVAREHARYNDDDVAVTFEKPFGYFETPTRRAAVFLYNENLERPKPHADILTALRELEARRVKLDSTYARLQDARGLYTEDFMWLRQAVIDQLTPRGFAGVVLAKHGIQHNEDMSRQAHRFEKDGKQYAFVTDFEFAQPIAPEYVSRSVIDACKDMFGLHPRREDRRAYDWLAHIDDVQTLEELFDVPLSSWYQRVSSPSPTQEMLTTLRRSFNEMKQRVEIYTGIPISSNLPKKVNVESGSALQDAHAVYNLRHAGELVLK